MFINTLKRNKRNFFFQQIGFDTVKGLQLTASVLTAEGEVYTTSGKVPYQLPASNTQVCTVQTSFGSLQISVVSSLNVIYLSIVVNNGNTANIVAAKLELGSVQTLTHQENGQWVLNEIPNYAEQYTICSQYSPITGEFVGSQHSNPNLLDNWYFVGGGSQQGGGQFPINQRGETEYTASGYTIDRWRKSTGTQSILVLDEQGLTVTPTSTANAFLRQPVENKNDYVGKTLTYSVLYKNAGFSTVTAVYDENHRFSVSNAGVAAYTTLDSGYCGEMAGLFGIIGDYLIAAKLELGPVQTFAHKEGDTWVLNDPPPNKALELAKCQRYQLVLSSAGSNIVGNGTAVSSTNFRVVIPTPVTMRTRPTLTYTGIWEIVPGGNITDLRINTYCENNINLSADVSGITIGNSGIMRIQSNSSGKIILDANL